jgi:hypothetical protein
MPVPKGTYNFFNSTRAKMDFIIAQIDVQLNTLKSERKYFANKSQIADEICPPISKALHERWVENGSRGSAPDPFNKSTLYRQVEYKSRVEAYLESQLVKGSEKQPRLSDGDKISELHHELSNAKHELKVLRKYIANLGAETTQTVLPASNSHPAESNIDFVKTAQVIALLLETFEGQCELQTDGSLVDLTKRANNVIASTSLLAPFLRWFKEQGKFNE